MNSYLTDPDQRAITMERTRRPSQLPANPDVAEARARIHAARELAAHIGDGDPAPAELGDAIVVLLDQADARLDARHAHLRVVA
jgi:hypothetical protein